MMNEFNTPITGAAHPSFGLAALCIIGGTVAFIKKGSKPSLLAGLSLGSSYALSGYLINQNKDYGLELASLTSSVLTIAMFKRYGKTTKFMPAGLMGGIGLCSSMYYSSKLIQQYNGFQ